MTDPESTPGAAAELLAAVECFAELAAAWHGPRPGPAPTGALTGTAVALHALNFALWHHEDAVRRPGVDDHEVAHRKRRIDDLNARRNEAIEQLDDSVLDGLPPTGPGTPLHTETPATVVDRLSVLALRIHHSDAPDADARRAVLDAQWHDLTAGLRRYLRALQCGQLGFRRYRQFKSGAGRTHCALYARSDGTADQPAAGVDEASHSLP